jgi:outer membrane protein
VDDAANVRAKSGSIGSHNRAEAALAKAAIDKRRIARACCRVRIAVKSVSFSLSFKAYPLELSNLFPMPSIFTKSIRIVLSTTLIFLFADAAFSDEVKIGYINTERVFREAPAAILSSKKIEAEFVERDKEIQRLATDLASKQSAFTENSLTLSDAQRRAKEFEINELAMTFKRRQREFKDDLQIRQAEANSAIIEKA